MASAFTPSRRTLLATGAGLAAAATLSACGANTAGGGDFVFLSTQFSPVEEKQRFEKILADNVKDYKVGYNTVAAASDMQTQVKTQVDAKQVKIGIIGGLHGDFAPIPTYLEDVDDLVADAKAAGIPDNVIALGKLGGDKQKYIPWMQATYVVAVNKKALAWLPAGADVNKLTYDQYLQWAIAAKAANGGKAVFGFPAGPKGLYHRFFQGYLLPSYTGGVITKFKSAEAINGWKWMQQLWQNINPASTNYDFMQEPLARGEVLVAWDHVARLKDAAKDNPGDWIMVPSPTGPQGLGYMLVIGGLAVPKGGDKAAAKKVIKALLNPATQLEVLKQNSFFPVVKADLPADLPAPVKLLATAVAAQQGAAKPMVALPPVGLGAKDGELSQVFKDCFAEICLSGKDPATVIPAQAAKVQTILDAVSVPCWAPDPVGSGTCKVG
jgi:multiple sugar transport system substrate-binding protein